MFSELHGQRQQANQYRRTIEPKTKLIRVLVKLLNSEREPLKPDRWESHLVAGGVRFVVNLQRLKRRHDLRNGPNRRKCQCQGLAAGTDSTMINVTDAGASNSPRQIPVTIALSPATTTTGSLTLSWNANSETDLAGYKVYVGTETGIYNAPVSIGTVTSYTVANLPTGRTYYASVTALDNVGNESLRSAEVSKPLNSLDAFSSLR